MRNFKEFKQIIEEHNSEMKVERDNDGFYIYQGEDFLPEIYATIGEVFGSLNFYKFEIYQLGRGVKIKEKGGKNG